MAPLKPLLDLKEQRTEQNSHYVCDAVKERYNHYISQDKQTWEDLIHTGHLVSLFIQGKQNLRWNPTYKNFYSIPAYDANSKMKITPIMGFYALNCEAKYISSNPDITVIAASEDDRVIQASKAAKIIVDHYEKKLYTNWHNIHEALLLMSFGTAITRIRWDSSKKGLKAITDIFEDKEFQISNGVGQCFDCGHSGTGDEYLMSGFAQCPNCQSQNAYAEPGATSIIPQKTGEKSHNLGDITLRSLPFPACRWDLRHTAEDSPWFIFEENIPLNAVQRYLGNVSLPDAEDDANSFGLKVVESLAKEANAVNGQTRSDYFNRSNSASRENVKLTEMSLSPEDLASIRLSGDERTVDGMNLPKGARMSELFPDGATVVGLNGFEVILGIYAEHHSQELSTGVWHVRPFSGAGRGHSDAVELQRRRNETDSQGYEAMRQNATPATFFAKDAIDEQQMQYISKPDVGIPVNLADFPNARSIQDLVASPRIGQVDASLLGFYIQNLENMMQLTMGTTSFSAGLPGVNNKTATGAQISDANADAIFAPMVGIKVDVRRRAAEMFVRLYRDNVPVEQYFPLEKKYGSQNGKWLSGADVDGDFIFDTVPNSELSKNRYTIMQDNERFFLAVGGAQGLLALQQANPEFADELQRRFGVDFETNHQDEVAQICRQRFQYAKQLLDQFLQFNFQQSLVSGGNNYGQLPAPNSNFAPNSQQQPTEINLQQNPEGTFELPKDDGAPTPEQAQDNALQQLSAPVQPQISPEQMQAQEILMNLQPPISVYEPNHFEKAKWFSYFLDTDEGRTLDIITRTVVYGLIEAHFTNGAQQQAIFAQMQGLVASAGSAPQATQEVMKQRAMGKRDDFTGQ